MVILSMSYVLRTKMKNVVFGPLMVNKGNNKIMLLVFTKIFADCSMLFGRVFRSMNLNVLILLMSLLMMSNQRNKTKNQRNKTKNHRNKTKNQRKKSRKRKESRSNQKVALKLSQNLSIECKAEV